MKKRKSENKSETCEWESQKTEQKPPQKKAELLGRLEIWLILKTMDQKWKLLSYPVNHVIQVMQALPRRCHTDRQRRRRRDVVAFDTEKKKIQVIVLPLRWNAGRLEPHSTHYLPLKCSLAGFQIQQGCKKEKTWTRMLTFSFCLNSQRNVGIKVTWYTVRHKKKFYLLYRGPTEVVAKSYSNRYMNWRSPFKGLNRLRK